MTTPPTLEQIAESSAHTLDLLIKRNFTPIFPRPLNPNGAAEGIPAFQQYRSIILTALQTATKQSQGADWAVEAAKKHGHSLGLDLKGDDLARSAAIIRKHAPLVANREDSERDSKRLNWLEAWHPDFRVFKTEDGGTTIKNGNGWSFSGSNLRATIDAAMRPAQPERPQECPSRPILPPSQAKSPPNR